ncbi:MAG: 50S ribosomal protein L9 [Planctomycetes bacterium]|nr:50S ribosomal protein L9 [Planctomycetota bacterium]NUQ34219.1 50S ribosomal protein L9 [Planctomycetaceae bacterium]
MKVILRESVEKLGRRGEVVAVAGGYARNYLIPQGFAAAATKENIRRVESEKKAYLAREAKRIEECQEIAAAIEKSQVSITMKVGPDGQMFGSVTARMIADALAEDGIKLETKMVRLDDPIKDLGVFPVRVHLHPEVDATAKVWVVEEKARE